MKITSGVFVLTILASMSTLGVVSTDIETEQQPQQGEKQQQHSWLRHEEQRLEGAAVKADIEEDLEAEYKTLMGPSMGARGTGRSKRARRGANRRLKPCKSSKSDGCDEDEPVPITYIIIASTPPPTPRDSSGIDRTGLILADFPRGFPCATGKPFQKMQVNPPTAFNGAYPQLIQKNNGQTENCTMRMLPDELGPAAAASMAGFEMNPENSIMEFSMEVGKSKTISMLALDRNSINTDRVYFLVPCSVQDIVCMAPQMTTLKVWPLSFIKILLESTRLVVPGRIWAFTMALRRRWLLNWIPVSRGVCRSSPVRLHIAEIHSICMTRGVFLCRARNFGPRQG